MLPASQRLRQARDIGRTMRQGRGVRGAFIRLRYLRSDARQMRWAFVVSNKVSKKATVRNKIRRRLKAVVSLHQPELMKRPPHDVLVVVSPLAAQRDYPQLRAEFERTLKMARFIDI